MSCTSDTPSAIPINKRETVSSVSTSVTSGFGTCSSVEDAPCDFEKQHSSELATHPEEDDRSSMSGSPRREEMLPFFTSVVHVHDVCDNELMQDARAERDSPSERRVDEEADSDSCSEQMREVNAECETSSERREDVEEDTDADEPAESQPKLRQLMREAVTSLPLPLSLQQFLLFYRD